MRRLGVLCDVRATGRREAYGVRRARDELRRREVVSVRPDADLAAVYGAKIGLRERAAEHARNLVGLSYGNLETRETYARTLAPNDTHASALSMASTSSWCGLTCEAVLRALGVDAEWLAVPYAESLTGGRPVAVVAQESEAKARGAWVDAMAWTDERAFPGVGDMISIGGDTRGTVWSDPGVYGGSHVFTIERLDALVHSVDGGQTDPLNRGRPTAITARQRQVQVRGETLWMVDPETGKGRRVRGWIDIEKM